MSNPYKETYALAPIATDNRTTTLQSNEAHFLSIHHQAETQRSEEKSKHLTRSGRSSYTAKISPSKAWQKKLWSIRLLGLLRKRCLTRSGWTDFATDKELVRIQMTGALGKDSNSKPADEKNEDCPIDLTEKRKRQSNSQDLTTNS
jgi:hypothetical protein